MKQHNFFITALNSFNRLLSLRLRVFALAIFLVIFVFIGCTLVFFLNLNKTLNEQTKNIGSNLSRQTAQLVQETLLLGDRLKLNLLLQDLAQNPLISYAVVYDANNLALAEIGTKYAYASAGDDNQEYLSIFKDNLFIQKIVIENKLIGQVHVQIDAAYLAAPFTVIWRNLLIVLSLSLFIAVFLSLLLSNYLAKFISKNNKLDSDKPIITNQIRTQVKSNVQEEVSSLNYNKNRTAVLVAKLGAQKQLHKLPAEKLLEITNYYRECLVKSSEIYGSDIYKINNGGHILLFHQKNCRQDYLTSAICCGELIRSLGHNLQIILAESSITLRLCLSLVDGSDLSSISAEKLVQTQTCIDAISLAQQSRNLLLVDQKLSNNAQLQKAANLLIMPNLDNCLCVERLLEPYVAQLEQNMQRIHF